MKFARKEIDYLTLMESLKEYAYPRDRVTRLLASGALVKVKKGLYLWRDKDEPYSSEVLANLIYGPSYVSLEYALQFHRLIPEAVRVVTSVTSGKNKTFDTQVGRFWYRHMPMKFYSPGIEYVADTSGKGFMIASPAKALFDLLYLNTPNLEKDEIPAHLFENLRMEPDEVSRIDFSGIRGLFEACPRASIRAFRAFLKERGYA